MINILEISIKVRTIMEIKISCNFDILAPYIFIEILLLLMINNKDQGNIFYKENKLN